MSQTAAGPKSVYGRNTHLGSCVAIGCTTTLYIFDLQSQLFARLFSQLHEFCATLGSFKGLSPNASAEPDFCTVEYILRRYFAYCGFDCLSSGLTADTY